MFPAFDKDLFLLRCFLLLLERSHLLHRSRASVEVVGSFAWPKKKIRAMMMMMMMMMMAD